MPFLILLIFFQFFLSLPQRAFGTSPSPTGLDLLLSDSKKNLRTRQGVLVLRMRDRKTLYEKNADLLLSPASVTKIATSAALLAKFSPIFTFTTRVYHTGQLRNGVISGNLIVVGDGDPMLVSEKLWQMAADLRNMGIREISGDLIIDQSLFDGEIRDEGRLSSAAMTQNAYDAPVTALGVNFNTVALSLYPGSKKDEKALMGLDPYPMPHVTIEGQVLTSGAEDTQKLHVRRKSSGESQEMLAVSGTVPSDKALIKVYRSVADPAQLSGETIKAFLSREGIEIKGRRLVGRNPKEAVLLYEIESYEMRRLVQGLNTYSNNYIADVLTKRLGAEFPPKGLPLEAGSGTYGHGLAVMRAFLREEVRIQGEFTLENGSGLDTDNRMTARQITEILAYMEQKMELFPDFIASLPATGWDGTMKKRFRTKSLEPFRGMVRAKTGTLTEPVVVAALAGYFRHDKHGWVAFCIIENGRLGSKQPSILDVRKRQDTFIAAMLKEL